VERDAGGMLWMGTQMSGLVRLDESLLSGLAGVSPDEWLIYPQPIVSTVHIRSGIPLTGMEVFRLDGSRVFEKRFQTGTDRYSADLHQTAAGLYIMTLHTVSGQPIVSKLIKL
jgi:hypothetical protein